MNKKTIDRTVKYIKEKTDKFGRYIHEHPIKAPIIYFGTAIPLAIGLLTGLHIAFHSDDVSPQPIQTIRGKPVDVERYQRYDCFDTQEYVALGMEANGKMITVDYCTGYTPYGGKGAAIRLESILKNAITHNDSIDVKCNLKTDIHNNVLSNTSYEGHMTIVKGTPYFFYGDK